MNFILGVFILVLIAPVLMQELGNAKQIINKLNKCAIEDRSQVDKCFTDFFIELRPELAAGIKEMNVPSIDALPIDRVDLPGNSTLFQGKAYFANLVIKGVGNYSLNDVKVDIPKQTITLKYFAPEVDTDANYNFDGHLQVIPFKGEGNVNVFLTDVNHILILTVEKTDTKLKLKVTDMKFTAESIKFRLDGKGASEAVNAYMNENAFEVIKELLPNLSHKLNDVYKKVFENVVGEISPEIFIVQ